MLFYTSMDLGTTASYYRRIVAEAVSMSSSFASPSPIPERRSIVSWGDDADHSSSEEEKADVPATNTVTSTITSNRRSVNSGDSRGAGDSDLIEQKKRARAASLRKSDLMMDVDVLSIGSRSRAAPRRSMPKTPKRSEDTRSLTSSEDSSGPSTGRVSFYPDSTADSRPSRSKIIIRSSLALRFSLCSI